ncbi:MAG: hypothetical protein QOD57_5481 [Actinomycetota bacterium]|nr:hypothetical protein [Actinomycetota bacterium]
MADHQHEDRHADEKGRAAKEDPLGTVGHHRPEASHSERAEEGEADEPEPVVPAPLNRQPVRRPIVPHRPRRPGHDGRHDRGEGDGPEPNEPEVVRQAAKGNGKRPRRKGEDPEGIRRGLADKLADSSHHLTMMRPPVAAWGR